MSECIAQLGACGQAGGFERGVRVKGTIGKESEGRKVGAQCAHGEQHVGRREERALVRYEHFTIKICTANVPQNGRLSVVSGRVRRPTHERATGPCTQQLQHGAHPHVHVQLGVHG